MCLIKRRPLGGVFVFVASTPGATHGGIKNSLRVDVRADRSSDQGTGPASRICTIYRTLDKCHHATHNARRKGGNRNLEWKIDGTSKS